MNAPLACRLSCGQPEAEAQPAAPGLDDPYISVSIDGRRFRVFYALGRAFWVDRELRDGTTMPGFQIRHLVPDCGHAEAVRVADYFLRGLSQGVAAQIADAVLA